MWGGKNKFFCFFHHFIISSNKRKKRTFNYLLSFNNRFIYLLDYNIWTCVSVASIRDAHNFFGFQFGFVFMAFDELNVVCNRQYKAASTQTKWRERRKKNQFFASPDKYDEHNIGLAGSLCVACVQHDKRRSLLLAYYILTDKYWTHHCEQTSP